MTRNNTIKKAIRERMKQTGEKYNVARKEIELSNIIVWELGEHGGSWFVENAKDEEIALVALKEWILSTDPESIKDYSPFKERLELKYRDDWFWKPINPVYPNEESVLMSKKKHANDYNAERIFSGFSITEK